MKPNNKHYFRLPIFSILMFLVTMIVNYGSMFGWFGMTQEEISNQYKNQITPASFTFSIWGLIYLLVIIFLIYQLYLIVKNKYEPLFYNRLNILFILTCILNISWTIAWVDDHIALATLFIFTFTLILGWINRDILHSFPREHHNLVPITFALYFGWLTVATVTNIAALLVKINWDMFGITEHLITCLVYIFIAFLAFFIIIRIKNPMFNVPIIWAFIGIYSTIQSLPAEQIHPFMPGVIIGVMIALGIESIYVFQKNNRQLLPQALITQIKNN